MIIEMMEPLKADPAVPMTEVQQIREQHKEQVALALQAFDQLGPTGPDVAQSLRSRSIKGGHSSSDCPLFRYLQTKGLNFHVGGINLYTHSHVGYVELAHMPRACMSFIQSYDGREPGFLDLQEDYSG